MHGEKQNCIVLGNKRHKNCVAETIDFLFARLYIHIDSGHTKFPSNTNIILFSSEMKPVIKIDSFFVKFWSFKIRENFIYLNYFVYPRIFFGATISLIWIFSGTKNCLLGNRYFKLKQFQVKLNNYQ